MEKIEKRLITVETINAILKIVLLLLQTIMIVILLFLYISVLVSSIKHPGGSSLEEGIGDVFSFIFALFYFIGAIILNAVTYVQNLISHLFTKKCENLEFTNKKIITLSKMNKVTLFINIAYSVILLVTFICMKSM